MTRSVLDGIYGEGQKGIFKFRKLCDMNCSNCMYCKTTSSMPQIDPEKFCTLSDDSSFHFEIKDPSNSVCDGHRKADK